MSKLYDVMFKEFRKELRRCSAEIFLYPLPFTQINRLAMLAATVAERCVAEQGEEAVCSCDVFECAPSVTEVICRHCGKPPSWRRRKVPA